MVWAQSVVGIITSIGTVLTALALVINAVTARRRDNKIEEKVDEVHVIVNQQRTDMQRYIQILRLKLKENNIDVPRDVSVILPDDFDKLYD